jgi:hypothetical protein
LDIVAGVATTFSNLLFLLFVIAFMALDAAGFANRLSRVRRQRREIAGALDTFVNGSRRYLAVATVFGLIVAVIDVGFLWLVGVPLAVLWGPLERPGAVPGLPSFTSCKLTRADEDRPLRWCKHGRRVGIRPSAHHRRRAVCEEMSM